MVCITGTGTSRTDFIKNLSPHGNTAVDEYSLPPFPPQTAEKEA